jgi:SagB-type dehydrogenase family enzyme
VLCQFFFCMMKLESDSVHYKVYFHRRLIITKHLLRGDRLRNPVIPFITLMILSLLFESRAYPGDNDKPASSPNPKLEVREMKKKLPLPRYHSNVSLEESLVKRRSVRDFSGEALTLEEVSQLLWAAQGITASWGGRTAPSAGALYPLEVYAVVGNVRDLAAGVYRYDPKGHEVVLIAEGDVRSNLAGAALGQTSVKDGAINLVFTAVHSRTTRKYGDRGIRYIYMEIGHAAQNVCLQATAMHLGAVPIGAFHDQDVIRILVLPKDEEPLYIIPVGKQR